MRKRGLSSVILPERATAAVFSDARRFLEPRAREWYAKHSIPYKRTYLLYGPPGCGKSSLINALASEFDCNVCMLSLADPDLKDDGLRQAMQRVPKRSVICLEDCDSVFNHHREKQERAPPPSSPIATAHARAHRPARALTPPSPKLHPSPQPSPRSTRAQSPSRVS